MADPSLGTFKFKNHSTPLNVAGKRLHGRLLQVTYSIACSQSVEYSILESIDLSRLWTWAFVIYVCSRLS